MTTNLRPVSAAAFALLLISFNANAAFVSGFGVSARATTFPDCPSGCVGGSDVDVFDGGEFA